MKAYKLVPVKRKTSRIERLAKEIEPHAVNSAYTNDDIASALTMEIDCLRYQAWWIRLGIKAIEIEAIKNMLMRMLPRERDASSCQQMAFDPVAHERIPRAVPSLGSQLHEGFAMIHGDLDWVGAMPESSIERHCIAPHEMDYWYDNLY